MRCDEARIHIPAYPAGTGPGDRVLVAAHLDSCGSCRAELAAYRRLQESMTRLADVTFDPPSWLLPEITRAVRAGAERLAARREAARRVGRPAAAGAALLVAGVAGAMVLRSRRRTKRAVTRRLRGSLAHA